MACCSEGGKGPGDGTSTETQRLMGLSPERKAKGREKSECALSLHGTQEPGSSVQVWASAQEQRAKEAGTVPGGRAEGKAHVREP